MNIMARELRESPLLWLLVAVPAVFAVEHLAPGRHTALFVLSVLAIVPLAALLSKATESVAARTGDAVGGLLNATLGNLTVLISMFAVTFVTSNGRSAWYVGVLRLVIYATIAMTLYLMPPPTTG
jgi:Ca2+:H+ antiporter